MIIDFGDDGDDYVKGEGAEPIDWEMISRLEALFQEVLADDDDDSRLTRSKFVIDEIQGG